MNNRRSASEQLIFNFLLSFCAVWFIFQYFNPQKSAPTVKPRPALTLREAFKGVEPDNGVHLTGPAATAEIAKMDANIKANGEDGLAQWSRLRKGLIEQYIVQKMSPVTIPGGLLSRSWQGNVYDELIHHPGDTNDELVKLIDAQAVYQKGDKLWRESKGKPTSEATTALEALLQKTRNDAKFGQLKIYEQTPDSADTTPQFQVKTVDDILGIAGASTASVSSALNPYAVLNRINTYYQTTTLYKVVDKVVHLFGAQPGYSYGLAILFFAVCTRLLMQPLTKKQYESMKGMQVIAPEMKKIQDKYKSKNDQQAQMQMVKEIQELQRKHGVSPMMGCGLSVIQIPIFIFIISPAMRHYEAQMELARASFLWIQHLARPDIPLLVLYGITMFVSFRVSSLPPTDEQQRQQQRMMMFMMPMFPFFLLHYPSAFTLYWMLFNITSTVLQYRMMKSSDPDKRIIKTLMAPLNPSLPTDTKPETKVESVPPRPKGGTKKPKALSEESTKALEDLEEDDSRNGTLNGTIATAEAGAAGASGVSSGSMPPRPRRKKRH